MAVYACCFTGNILKNSSQGHWEVKIFSIAAEGTKSVTLKEKRDSVNKQLGGSL